MTNQELIACIQAEERGEVVECRNLSGGPWRPHKKGLWDTCMFEYRILRKPRKCWVRFGDEDTRPLVAAHQDTKDDADWIKDGWQLVVEDVK